MQQMLERFSQQWKAEQAARRQKRQVERETERLT
jgi:hypothetical protein